MIFTVEKIRFSRPNCDGIELGLRITNEERSVIIDSDMNIVINAVYKDYERAEYSNNYHLEEWNGERI